MNETITVIFDNNSWISFSMKRSRLQQIETLLHNPKIQILSCPDLIKEFDKVSMRDHLQKYFISERIEKAKVLLREFSLPFEMQPDAPQICRDPKDDYFLYFATEYDLDFIVTGDKDLLVLETHGRTQIVNFNRFCEILIEKGIIAPPQ
jgi:uncharacterized protein